MTLKMNANDIDQWFSGKRRKAQEKLPELIRRLVTETVPPEHLKALRIPSGDQIGLPGYDGLVESNLENHSFVPMGNSVWEYSTSDVPSRQAKENIEKRKANPQGIDPSENTFIFVTPHNWTKKRDWVKSRNRNNTWHDVVVIDCVDLEQWLGQAPATERWLARSMGIAIEGIRNVDEYWQEELNARYRDDIPTDLIVGGRVEASEQVVTWLDTDDRVLRIEGETVEEAAAFFAAVIQGLPEPNQESITSRCVFIHIPEVVDQISSLNTPHFIVALTPEVRGRAFTRAKENSSFRIVEPLPKPANSDLPRKPALILGPIQWEACHKTLREMGYPELKARKFATESKGSPNAVLWMVAEEHDIPIEWAKGPTGFDLIPLLFCGQWDTQCVGDLEIIERISGLSPQEVDHILAEWATPNGPFIKRLSIWDWIAWPYAWQRLSSFINRAHLERLCEVALKVLSEPDPSLELEPQQRYVAAIYGKQRRYSDYLREGLVDTLTLLAVNNHTIEGSSGQEISDRIVFMLLGGEQYPLKTSWLSLSYLLPQLAEGSPNSFSRSLDILLDDSDAVSAMFAPEGFLTASGRHTGLLWALERLAWSPHYLTRVVLALGRLAIKDPGGNLANRPINSIKEILLPWYPQTAANVQDRLVAIGMLFLNFPEIAWQTAISLLPNDKLISSSTSMPKWREWKPEGDIRPTTQEYWSFMEALVNKMLACANHSGQRWADLVAAYPAIRLGNPALGDSVMAALQALESEKIDDQEKMILCDALHKVISHHKQFPEAEWSIKAPDLQPLEELCDRYQPIDTVDKYVRLFAMWPEIGFPDTDWQEHEKILAQLRSESARSIFSEKGVEGFFELAGRAERPDNVGHAAASIDLDEISEATLLQRALGLAPTREGFPPHLRMGWGYVQGKFQQIGFVWVDRITSSHEIKWDANKLCNLSIGLPTNSDTWRLLSHWGKETEHLYWQRAYIRIGMNKAGDTPHAITQLMEAGRPYHAIEQAYLGCWIRQKDGTGQAVLPVSTELLIDLLMKAPYSDPTQEWPTPTYASLPIHVEILLDLLEHNGVGTDILAKIEWLWLQVISGRKRGFKAIHEEIVKSPALFVDFLKEVFNAEGAPVRELTETEQQKVQQATHFLINWHKVPGVSEEEPTKPEFEGDITFSKGNVDPEVLFTWIKEAVELAEKYGRKQVCLSRIGQLLAYSPAEPDGIWPCVEVRDLIENMREIDPEDSMADGFVTGVYNKRGAHFRGKGGDQERLLEKKFRGFAAPLNAKWPRTASLLDRIAQKYQQEAKYNDERALLDEFE